MAELGEVSRFVAPVALPQGGVEPEQVPLEYEHHHEGPFGHAALVAVDVADPASRGKAREVDLVDASAARVHEPKTAAAPGAAPCSLEHWRNDGVRLRDDPCDLGVALVADGRQGMGGREHPRELR